MTSVEEAAPAPLFEAAALRGVLVRTSGVAWLVALIGVAIALRFHQLGDQSLWLDEVASAYFARVPLHLLWSDWMVRETNPPLYYTLLHYWVALFGDSEAALRGLSVLLGAASIPLTYALGREICSRQAGLLAATLACVWTPQITFSQEARGYMLGLVAAQVALLGLCRIAKMTMTAAQGPRWPFFAYGIGTLAALYSHTTLFILPLLANAFIAWLWWFRSPRSRRILLPWLATNALCAMGWLWWVAITLQQLSVPESNINWIPMPDIPALLAIVQVAYLPYNVGGLGLIFALAAAGLAAYGLTRLAVPWAVLLILVGLGVPAILFLISQHTPVLLARTVFWAHVALVLALAVGLTGIPRRGLRIAAIGLVLAGAVTDVVATKAVRDKEPWRDVVESLNSALTARDVVVFSSPGVGAILDYYCRRLTCTFQVAELMDGLGEAQRASNRWAEDAFHGRRLARDTAAAVLGRYSRIVELRRGDSSPDPLLRSDFRFSGTIKTGVALPENMTVAVWRPSLRALRS